MHCMEYLELKNSFISVFVSVVISSAWFVCLQICLQKNLWKYGDFREDEDKEFGYRP